MNRPRVVLTTFGCQMNKLDSEIAEASLLRHGFVLETDPEKAVAVLFNTCSVRDNAENRVVSRLSNLLPLKRERPDLVLGVIGCMGQEHGRDFLDKHPHVSLVTGTRQYSSLGAILERALAGERVVAVDDGVDAGAGDRDPVAVPVGHRAFVAIQRGCSMHCAYCIVPQTRGDWRSRPVAQIIEECERVIGAGAVDLTLLGQTVDAWGLDRSPRESFADLLRRVHELPGLERLHFVTSHPAFLAEDVARCFADLPRLSRWVHLPAQSGSDRMLAAMKRGYTSDKYLHTLELIRKYGADVEVASDFICGFPGETDADHQATLALMRQAEFSQCYIFKYSPRPGTVAEHLGTLPEDVVIARHHEVLALHEEIAEKRNRALVGTVQQVMVEGPSPRNPSRLTGRSAHHRIVHFPATDQNLAGKILPVRIDHSSPFSLIGSLVQGD